MCDMYNDFGAGFKSAVFLLARGSMIEYRSDKEVEELKRVFTKLFFEDYKLIEKYIKQFVKDYSNLIKHVEESKNIKDYNSEQLIKLVKDFTQYYRAIWHPVLIIFWIPLWLERDKLSEEDKQKVDYLVKVRHDHDREYVSAMFFYDNIYQYIKDKYPDLDYNFSLLTPEELITILKEGKLDIEEELVKRTKGTLVLEGKVLSYTSFEQAAELVKDFGYYLPPEEKIEEQDILKGQVACKGDKVRGKVKLLYSREDMPDVEEGDIIVSPMTTPYFDPVLKKAKAIITDEGGIVCHAAIVARELKVPCIIGTKIATQVLKDGDQVEVDANNGIIRKL